MKGILTLELLRDLNELNRGVDKKWIYGNPCDYALAHDYLEKINYSIQDINELLRESGRIERRADVVLLIVLTDWIVDSVRQYKLCIRNEVMSGFRPSDEDDLDRRREFLKCLRSFVVAHPLVTDRHPKLGLDGDLVCIDLTAGKPFLPLASEQITQRFGLGGIEQYDGERDDDVFLHVYSKSSEPQFRRYLTVDLAEVVEVARKYIKLLYRMNAYLDRQKRTDYDAAR